MESQVITTSQIREYLLGRLDEDSKLVEQIDLQMLEPGFSDSVDCVEDEIIEEYIEGTLTLRDKQAVESYFLRPPERQSRLRAARLLAHRLAQQATQAPTQPIVEAPAIVLPFTLKQPLAAPSRLRSLATIAAVLAFAVGLAYLRYQLHITGIALEQSSRQLVQERQHAAQLRQQLQAELRPSSPSIVTLNLLNPGLARGSANLPEITLTPSTTTLHLEIALSAPSGLYHIQLLRSGKPLLPSSDHIATALDGGSVVQLDLPAQALPAATYELTLTPLGESYWFRVRKAE